MKFDLTKPILALGAVPIYNPDKTHFCLKQAIVQSLQMDYDEHPRPTGNQKYERYSLAKRINDLYEKQKPGDPPIVIELSVPDLEKIRHVLGLNFAPQILGPCYDLLDNDAIVLEQKTAPTPASD